MKKSAIFLFLILIGLTAFSQRFNGGVVAGMATSQVAGDTYSGFHKVGAIGGFFVNYQPSAHSAFQMEITFLQKGSRDNANAVEEDYDSYLLRLNYIELPILYQYHFGWFALEAGPSLGFFVSGYEENNGQDVKADNFAAVTFQLNFGVVFTVADDWKFGIRTNNSFTNLRTQTYTGNVARLGTHGQFNDVLMFTFAYQFMHFGK